MTRVNDWGLTFGLIFQLIFGLIFGLDLSMGTSWLKKIAMDWFIGILAEKK
jgi:hypothetical protein